MRKLKYCSLLLLPVLLFSFKTKAQETDIIRQQSCNYSSVRSQIDSLKAFYRENGFELLREASMQMVSQYEMPVVVPLRQREWYSFVFIGDPGSKLFEVRMYDYSENQVYYQKNLRKDANANVINFTYEPNASEYHMIKPVQVNNDKKDLCGYVMLFRKTATAPTRK